MPLSDLSSRQAVLDAIAECDRLGRDAFLSKYGFRRSVSYFLVHEGREYDSKAIVGAAHGYQFPATGPLGAKQFSGGEKTVRRKLQELGFDVRVLEKPIRPARAAGEATGSLQSRVAVPGAASLRARASRNPLECRHE